MARLGHDHMAVDSKSSPALAVDVLYEDFRHGTNVRVYLLRIDS